MPERKKLKTALGVDENVEGALCYFLGFFTGIAFLLLEKKSNFVRFHAMQSTATFLLLFVVSVVLPFTIIGIFLVPFVGLVGLVLWLLLMYKAYVGERFKLPIIGKFAEKQV
jgi:uncharacterized membrane protein